MAKLICSKCKKSKPLTIEYFRAHKHTRSGFNTQCRQCEKDYRKGYNFRHKKERGDYDKEYQRKLRNRNENKIVIPECKKCSNCKEVKASDEFYLCKTRKDGIGCYCKKCKKDYEDKNRDKGRIRTKKYYLTHKKEKNEYVRNRLKTDIEFRLLHRLRSRLGLACSLSGNKKAFRTEELLGCSVHFFKEYMEAKFETGMTWDNHSFHGWHIDHIKPCAAFDLSKPEQQKECFHYTNLQPLWAGDNMSKNSYYKWKYIRKNNP